MSTIITDNPYTFTVSDNMSINAVFEDDANITVYKYPSCSQNIATITGAGSYSYGSTCTLTATKNSGITTTVQFIWLDLETGDLLGSGSTLSFTVSKSQTIYCGTIMYLNDNGTGIGYHGWGGASFSNLILTFRNGTSKKLSVSGGTNYQRDSTIPQYNITKISGPTTKGIEFFQVPGFFNLIHDSSNALGANNFKIRLTGCIYSTGRNSDSTCYTFGPRNGEIIYLYSEYPWGNQANTPEWIIFQQKNAPDFNVKMNIPSGIEVHYPSYGVGYNSDWVARNFTSNTPTLVVDNNY